jgi:hypothetical protein
MSFDPHEGEGGSGGEAALSPSQKEVLGRRSMGTSSVNLSHPTPMFIIRCMTKPPKR